MNNDNPAFWQDLAKKAPAGCRILSPTRRSGAFFDFVNDLISDEKSSCSKPIRAILSVTLLIHGSSFLCETERVEIDSHKDNTSVCRDVKIFLLGRSIKI